MEEAPVEVIAAAREGTVEVPVVLAVIVEALVVPAVIVADPVVVSAVAEAALEVPPEEGLLRRPRIMAIGLIGEAAAAA